MGFTNVQTLYLQIRIKHLQCAHEIFSSPGEVRTDGAAILWHTDPRCPGQTPSIPLVSTALLQHTSDQKYSQQPAAVAMTTALQICCEVSSLSTCRGAFVCVLHAK